jgi:hypothetical protein
MARSCAPINLFAPLTVSVLVRVLMPGRLTVIERNAVPFQYKKIISLKLALYLAQKLGFLGAIF